ncbi:MAG: exodeoxyribonuclease VII large subunit [Bacteroidales bacterium]|nr:exodeoxyribonuclease VII large subunit [Bacteroidales bacterium]
MARDYLELAELQARIKEGIEDAFPGKVWVKAEISSWSPRANGHCYLSLSQSRGGKVTAESRAMIWKWNFLQLKTFFEETTGQVLQAGITVLVRVQVSFSELYGISLFIDDIDPAFTLGEKALERKRAIERLTAGGYMDMQKELALPALPYRLAVVTSRTAAGYGDFRRHLMENPEGYVFRLDLYEALMQGEGAPSSIIAALAEASEGSYDAILLLRGGGSELDLACFDDYDLAVAIATCGIPVITAIGHDRNYHIADMVAHAFVKTPTALADLFLEAYEAEDAALDALQRRIAGGLMEKTASALRQTDAVRARIRMGWLRRLGMVENDLQRCSGRIMKGLLRKYTDVARLSEAVGRRLQFAAGARYSAEVSRLALKEALIKASDPRNILGLGYVLVTGKDNKVLKTVDKVAVGDRIGVRFSDGSLLASVDEVFSEKLDNDKVNIA